MGKITYYKLWDKLKRMNIRQLDLKEQRIVSSGTLDKLRKNETVNTETLIKLCDYLKCDISEIMEYAPNEK